MAATSNIQSPLAAGDGGATAAAVLNSPKSSRHSGRGGSPWTQIVRVGVEEPVFTAAPATGSPRGGPERRVDEESDDSIVEVEGVGVNNAAKKPAWNKPSNGVVEVSPVMGAVSWPALGESTKASPKSASPESLKTLSDAALPTLQAFGNSISSPHNQVIPNNLNPISAPNPVATMRQKSMKRGGGNSSGLVNGGSSQPRSPQPQNLVGETLPHTTGKPNSATESSPRDHPHKSHGGNEQQHQRNPFRKGNGGPQPRGDGSYHHNGKRDQDRGHQEWNHRGYGQPQRGFPNHFVRPSTSFIAPPMPGAVRPPFANPMGYPDMPPHHLIYVQAPPPPDSLRAMPLVAPIPPHGIFFPAPESQLHVPDLQLHAKIVNQIDYYFSENNLVKDLFLRKNMDHQGWVPIKLIAGFKKGYVLLRLFGITIHVYLDREESRIFNQNLTHCKVPLLEYRVEVGRGVDCNFAVNGEKPNLIHDVLQVTYLTENISIIIEALRSSTVVEVQGDKVRTQNDWMKWPIPQATGNSGPDMLASSLQSVSLNDSTSNHQGEAERAFGRSSSGEFNSHSGAEGMGQVSTQAGVSNTDN